MANPLTDDDETPTNTRWPSPHFMHNEDYGDDMLADENEVQPNNPAEDKCRCESTRCRDITLARALDLALGAYSDTQNNSTYLTQSHMDNLWPILTRGQMDRPTYLALLAEYCPQRHCSIVWAPGSIAYRCRTCSKAPNMALCAECFKCGNHEGHNYIMFKSQSGGTCDCGMDFVMSSGHCSKHGPNAVAKRADEDIPEELICVPRRTMPRFVHRLLVSLRSTARPNEIGSEADLLMDNLSQIACDSSILRCLIVDALISEDVYDSQLKFMINHPDDYVSRIISDGLKVLERNRKGFIAIQLPESWNAPKIQAFDSEIKVKCFLEELVFWTVCLEFPQKLVSFLLSFQMDDRYKEMFARTFVNYYPYVMMNLVIDADEESRRHLRESYRQMVRRIIQISSQIHADAHLVNTLNKKDFALHTIIYCLRIAIEGSTPNNIQGLLRDNPSANRSANKPKIINHNSVVIKNSHLMPFTQDLNNMLCSEREALLLIGTQDLLKTWIKMMRYFQTMNPCKRYGDRDLSPDDYAIQNSLFALEMEFCLYPLWSILSHFKRPTLSYRYYQNNLFRTIHANLLIWFDKMGINPNTRLDPYRMSFYIPLHRMFGVTLRHLMYVLSRSDKEICDIMFKNYGLRRVFKCLHTPSYRRDDAQLISCGFFKILLKHPLQVLATCNEARCTMGMRMLGRGQAVVTYSYLAYCYSTIDLDMFLLKLCASKLDANYFLTNLMKKFHAFDWLSFAKKPDDIRTDDLRSHQAETRIMPDQLIQLAENSFMIILQLLTLNIWCDISERKQTIQELIASISVRDRSYSYLVDMMPEKNQNVDYDSIDRNCRSILEEIAIFNPAQHSQGRLMQQGSYTLKQSIWEHDYDPVQVQYRFSQKRDCQMSLERYYRVCKQIGLLPKDFHSYSSLWPPFKIPETVGCFGQLNLSNLLESSSLFGSIFTVLYKSLYQVDVPDSMIASAIHLMELALRKCMENKSSNLEAKDSSTSHFKSVLHYDYLLANPALKSDPITGQAISVQDKSKKEDQDLNDRFPVVRNALDLAFDGYWYPYKSILDNLLVHIENVHSSISETEFASMLKDLSQDIAQQSTAVVGQQKASCSGISAQGSAVQLMNYQQMDVDFFLDADNEGTTSDDFFGDDSEEDADIGFTDNEEDQELAETLLQQSNLLWPNQPARGTQRPEIVTSANTESGETVVMPESQSTALSLIPINQQRRISLDSGNNTEQQQQEAQAENLVTTPRRAITASDPRPMIEAAVPPLALEASPSSPTQPRSNDRRHSSQEQAPEDVQPQMCDRILSEFDIHARFTNFFNPRADHQHPTQMSRQMAVRSSGPLPYHLHHRIDTGTTNQPTTPTRVQEENPQVRQGSLFSPAGGTYYATPPPPFISAARPGRNVVRRSLIPPANPVTSGPSDDRITSRTNARVLLNRVLGARSLGRQQQQQQQHEQIQQQHHQRQSTQRGVKSRSSKLRQQDKSANRSKDRIGESLLTLLLRLHAKYSQRANSYEFNEQRAQANASVQRSRIGNGVHFVTIVLDLVCILDDNLRQKLKQLQNLIWAGEEATTMSQRLKVEIADDISSDSERVRKMAYPHASDEDSTAVGDRSSSSGKAGSSSLMSDSAPSSTPLSQAERRRKAKEYQSKVMAQFANKQRAFIESLGSQGATSRDKQGQQSAAKAAVATATTHSDDEEPINLSSKSTIPEHDSPMKMRCDLDKQPQKEDKEKQANKALELDDQVAGSSKGRCRQVDEVPSTIYECCICGLEGESDLANPFGQVVHLQSTSILGHAHLRPQKERRLPCEETHHLELREETYAKYLERRIDLLCQHFSESSWLDSINIGAEGGVHVQSCGHYLHIECHQSYMKTVNQDRRRYFGQYGNNQHGGNSNSNDEFPCPVCRQLANSLLPILRPSANSRQQPGHLPLGPQTDPTSTSVMNDSQCRWSSEGDGCGEKEDQDAKDDLGQQIKLIGSLLGNRSPPHYKELQSSASFCAHLTKATGPQYRLVRSNASMHSLFLFLTSIARTNLETELIVRQALSRSAQTRSGGDSCNQAKKPPVASTSASASSAKACGSGSSVAEVIQGSSSRPAQGPPAAADKRNCLLNLLHVLALNAQTLINDQWFSCDEIWSRLTNSIDEQNRLSIKPTNGNEVPLLLRDPVAMLLQFLFATINSTASPATHQANFACLVKILFNLTAIQSIALLLSYLEASSDDDEAPLKVSENDGESCEFIHLLSLVKENLGPLLARANEEPLMNTLVRSSWPRFAMASHSQLGNSCDMDVDAAGVQDQDSYGKVSSAKKRLNWPNSFVENRVKLACLPFMRAAALLRHHLYSARADNSSSCCYPELVIVSDEQLTNAEAIETDFTTLATYLDLSTKTAACWQVPMAGSPETVATSATGVTASTTTRTCLAEALNWPPAAGFATATTTATGGESSKNRAELIGSWSRELLVLCREFSIAARTLLVCRPLTWFPPSLMTLPQLFDDVFMFYYRKKCSLCHQVRRDVAVCLVCGAPICFRMSCCKERARSRLVHSQHCGSSISVFLAVHTSSIVVIQGTRASVWGSVYLDEHGEEDNGLQRGKPLYLVPARFQLLQHQWLTHSFDDKYSKIWINLLTDHHHHHQHHHI